MGIKPSKFVFRIRWRGIPSALCRGHLAALTRRECSRRYKHR